MKLLLMSLSSIWEEMQLQSSPLQGQETLLVLQEDRVGTFEISVDGQKMCTGDNLAIPKQLTSIACSSFHSLDSCCELGFLALLLVI